MASVVRHFQHTKICYVTVVCTLGISRTYVVNVTGSLVSEAACCVISDVCTLWINRTCNNQCGESFGQLNSLERYRSVVNIEYTPFKSDRRAAVRRFLIGGICCVTAVVRPWRLEINCDFANFPSYQIFFDVNSSVLDTDRLMFTPCICLT